MLLPSVVDITETRPEWLEYPESQALFAAIERRGGLARFVGGCVRDAFFGKISDDLDVCTDLLPQTVMEALKTAGFKVFPTGLDHGTITAVLKDRKFEVTTLRLDLETHGRRATVAFTQDFQEDAARRDFTFNALSVDGDGRLYDYFNGLPDLKAGHVRFIGQAEERIAEDYLRVLRYFRFYARYGRGTPDDEAVKACQNACSKLKSLSLERITRELKSLFSVSDPYDSLMLMEAAGVRQVLLPGTVYADRLKKAIALTEDPLLRLVAYFGADTDWAKRLPTYLRLSGQNQTFLESICNAKLESGLGEAEFKQLAYWRSLEVIKGQCLILKTTHPQAADNYLQHLEGWNIPNFPLKGGDLLSMGFAAGPKVGKVLKLLEEAWVESNFSLTETELLSQAKLLKP